MVNETTWRLKRGTSAISRAVFERGGAELAARTTKLHKTGRVGVAYPVAVPPSSTLRSQEDVYVVIHVVIPNINEKKADALSPSDGHALLRQTYQSSLQTFAQLALS